MKVLKSVKLKETLGSLYASYNFQLSLTLETLLNFTAVLGLRFSAYLVLIIVLTSMPVAAVTFVDVTDAAGIRFQHSSGTRSSLLPEDMGSGAGFADIDNDGDIDLYVVNIPGSFKQNGNPVRSGTANVLYRNNGNGTFIDITQTAGVGHQGYGIGVRFCGLRW